MEASSPPNTHPFYQLAYTVAGLLPAPFDEAPAAFEGRKIKKRVSENGTNSHNAAFETMLSEQPWNRRGSGETELPELVREAIAKSRPAGWSLPADSRENTGTADDGRRIGGDTASI